MIDYGVGRITLLDSSAKMMNIAKDKFKDAIDKNIIDAVISTKLPNLPFPDGMFDAVMFNLVSFSQTFIISNLTKTHFSGCF